MDYTSADTGTNLVGGEGEIKLETTAPPQPKVYLEPEAMFTAEEMLNAVSVGPPAVLYITQSHPNPKSRKPTLRSIQPMTEAFSQRDPSIHKVTGEWVQRLTDPRQRNLEPLWSVDTCLVWLPGDTHLAFLSDRTGSPQIWTVRVLDGSLTLISNFTAPVAQLKFSHAHCGFLFVADTETGGSVRAAAVAGEAAGVARLDDVEEEEEEVGGPPRVAVFNTVADMRRVHADRHVWMLNIQQELDDEASRVLGVDCTVWRQAYHPIDLLEFANQSVESYDMSSSGALLSFAGRDGACSPWSNESSVYILPVPPRITAPPQKISSLETANMRPVFAPDGLKLAYFGMEKPGNDCDRLLVKVYSIGRQVTQTVLKRTMPGPHASASMPVWVDNQQLIITAPDAGRLKMFSVNIEAEVVRTVSEEGTSSAIAIANGSKPRIVYLKDSIDRPPEVFVCDFNGTKEQPLTQFNDIDRYCLARPEELWFTGADGEMIHSWLLTPYGLTEETSCSLVVLCLGDFLDHYEQFWNMYVFAAEGHAVLAVNYHGAVGFGNDFADCMDKDWADKATTDIMSGVDAALDACNSIDESRMALVGVSIFGGFLVNYLHGQTDRFACMVVHDGMFDPSTFFYNTVRPWTMEHNFNGFPWESEDFIKYSPQKYVGKWSTPTLVIMSGKDDGPVRSQVLSTFVALQRRGIPSQLATFPDEVASLCGTVRGVVVVFFANEATTDSTSPMTFIGEGQKDPIITNRLMELRASGQYRDVV